MMCHSFMNSQYSVGLLTSLSCHEVFETSMSSMLELQPSYRASNGDKSPLSDLIS